MRLIMLLQILPHHSLLFAFLQDGERYGDFFANYSVLGPKSHFDKTSGTSKTMVVASQK